MNKRICNIQVLENSTTMYNFQTQTMTAQLGHVKPIKYDESSQKKHQI